MSFGKFVGFVCLGLCVLASSAAMAGVSMMQMGSVLVIKADANHEINVVQVEQYGKTIVVDYWCGENLLVSSTYFGYQKFRASEIDTVFFWGSSNSDLFANQTAIPCQAYGNLGDDFLMGGDKDDYLDGGGDDDELIGGDGDDDLYGNSGKDGLYGGLGKDYLNPGSSREEHYLVGGPGKDIFDIGRLPSFTGQTALLDAVIGGLPNGFPYDYNPFEDTQN